MRHVWLVAVLSIAVAALSAMLWVRGATGEGTAAAEALAPADGRPYVVAATPEDAGRYLIVLGGCNDCHTPGWLQTGGKVPQEEWLLGQPLGHVGPWGTTYPGNVRQFMGALSEEQWVELAHRWEARPPMPAFNLHDLSDRDLRAIHRFVRSLGPVGDPQPRYLPPGETPTTPYLDFHVKNLPPVE